MSMCEARMKQKNDQRMGSRSTPAAKTQKRTRATINGSSASVPIGGDLLEEPRPGSGKFWCVVFLDGRACAATHVDADFGRERGEASETRGDRWHGALHPHAVVGIREKFLDAVKGS